MGTMTTLALFEKPCLVDVDTQADFALPEGAWPTPGAAGLLPLWKQLTEFAQKHRLPMIATMECHGADDPEFGHDSPHCVRGTPGWEKLPGTRAEHYHVVPVHERETTIDFEAQLIIEKATRDLFSNPQAESVISAVPCSIFAVYGLTTEGSVKLAVLGLLARGHRVYVISDAIKANETAAGERALTEMANAGAGFVQSGMFFEKVRQYLDKYKSKANGHQ